MVTHAGLGQVVSDAVAVVVATCDPHRRPALGRAWGLSLDPDRDRLTVCVEAPAGSAMARNLQADAPVAITLARLTSHHSVQCTGSLAAVAAPSAEDLAAVADHVERFVAEGAKVGMPQTFARGLVGRELLSVTIELAGATEETPGPHTGRAL